MPLPSVRTQKEPNYLKKIYLFYGQPKAGKTTTAAAFGDDDDNRVLFFATEPGHKFQEIYKWQTENGRDPQTWSDFLECCRELAKAPAHSFNMVAIDIVDNLWKWCALHVCKQQGIKHESDLDFGKGYAFIREEFMKPINWLGQSGYGIMFLSHSQDRDKDIGFKKLNYTDSTLPGSAKKVIHGLCDYILYFHLDLDGNRFIRTKGTETVNAGDRSGNLPELVGMNAAGLIKELQ